MDQARDEARSAGETRYSGKDCKHGHGTERYVSNGGCVVCVSGGAVKPQGRPRKKPLMSQMEVQALLLRGGPDTRVMAEMAGLEWYNHPRDFRGACHGIIGLSGYCPLCGNETPEVISPEVEALLS